MFFALFPFLVLVRVVLVIVPVFIPVLVGLVVGLAVGLAGLVVFVLVHKLQGERTVDEDLPEALAWLSGVQHHVCAAKLGPLRDATVIQQIYRTKDCSRCPYDVSKMAQDSLMVAHRLHAIASK